MPWETPPHTILSGNTAGTTNIHGPVATFVASDNITLSGSGNRIVFMGAAGGTGAVAGPAIAAGTQTATASTVVFSNSNNVTFGMSGSTRVTASASFPAQTAFVLSASNGLPSAPTAAPSPAATPSRKPPHSSPLRGAVRMRLGSTPRRRMLPGPSTRAGSASTRGYAGTATAVTNAGLTVNSAGVSVSVGPFITTARASTDAIGLNTAQSNVTWTANSSGLSIDARGYAGTATGATNASVTANSGGVSVAVGNGVTATGNLGAIAVNAVTTYTSGTVVFSNSNGVTFGTNAQTITGSVNTSYRASNDAIGLNTAQTNVTWTANSSGLSLNAGGYAGTVSGATNCSVTANTAGSRSTSRCPSVSYWENPIIDGMTSWSGTSNSISVQRIFIPPGQCDPRGVLAQHLRLELSGR
jgi:hypothetical protein